VDDPFKQAIAGWVGGKNVTLLHRVLLSGQADIFNLLLEKGCQPFIDTPYAV
jgi:hypothetical protein